jgi:hypothetical protein
MMCVAYRAPCMTQLLPEYWRHRQAAHTRTLYLTLHPKQLLHYLLRGTRVEKIRWQLSTAAGVAPLFLGCCTPPALCQIRMCNQLRVRHPTGFGGG